MVAHISIRFVSSSQWLNENRLIESMIGLLDPSLPRDTHDNASRLLIEVFRVSRYVFVLNSKSEKVQ